MPYPKEWESNPAYDLHIENYKRSHPEEYPHHISEEIKLLKEILNQSKEQTFILREIYKRTPILTPTQVTFKEKL
jgi:hypothetical protein